MLPFAKALDNLEKQNVKQPKEQQPDNDLDVVNPSNYPTNARRVILKRIRRGMLHFSEIPSNSFTINYFEREITVPVYFDRYQNVQKDTPTA
jgi:hypothetical protein